MGIAILDREVARQQSILEALPILADVMRSDVLYYDGIAPDQLVVAGHAQPHSTDSLYSASRKGQAFAVDKLSPLGKAIRYGAHGQHIVNVLGDGAAPVYQEVWPLRDQRGVVMGALSIETSASVHASVRRRGNNLTSAFQQFTQAVIQGRVRGAADLSPFTASDGLVVVDRNLRIGYVSPIAEELYHNLGVRQKLAGTPIDLLETGDERLLGQAFQARMCLEREAPARDAIWLRKVIPLFAGASERDEPQRTLLLIRDVTEERRRAQEQLHLEAMIREIHHRVKNNLQTIISLARVDARRAQSPETKRALEELINRVFAVAQVHEFLAADPAAEIQLKEVSRQIAKQVRQSLLPAESRISIEVEGDAVHLSPKQATACALLVNELVQNAVEHAFDPNAEGFIRVQLEDAPDRVRIAVVDNGRGLPDGFDWRTSQSLGLKIVNTLAQELRGELSLRNQHIPAHGLIAQITLSRILPGGH